MRTIRQTLFSLALASLALACAAFAQEKPAAAQSQADPARECACEAGALPEVLATVGDVRVTQADISPEVRKRIADLQRQVVEARRRELDLQINTALLEAEAKKRGLSTAKLLEAEVVSKTQEPTETEAQKFYDENRARIEGEFAQLKDQIVQYLREVETRKANVALAERLRAAARVQTFLAPPAPPAYKIATDDQPSKGGERAAVMLVEFTDYQCPSCAKTQPALERLVSEYGGRVRLVVRDYPLSQHKDAQKAAEAAEAAREQGKYWEYVALLFQNPSALQTDKLKEYATRAGLDRAKFDEALDSGRFAEKVQRDVLDGDRVGVDGTPTIFLNGRRVADTSYEGLKTAVESALNSAAQLPKAAGVRP